MNDAVILLAHREDMPEVAKVFKSSRRHSLPYLPELHRPEEDIRYFGDVALPGNRIFVARAHTSGSIIGFIAFNDEWLNLRLLGEIEQATFSKKQTELRDQQVEITLRLEGTDRQQSDHADTAVKSFELSQKLSEQWLTADVHEKRMILDLLCLNCRLDDVSLVLTMRKPFDLLVEGLFVQSTRGERI